MIKELNTLVPNGYNLETGGHKNKHLSEETKQIIRNIHLGKTLPEETRRKMSISRKGKNNPIFGKPRSETTKQKISERAIERYKNKEKHPMFGKHHSETSLEKMRKSKIGQNNPMWGKKIKD